MSTLTTSTLDSEWQSVAHAVRAEVGDDVFEAWFANVRVEYYKSTSNTVCLSVANKSIQNLVSKHVNLLTKLWNEERGQLVKIKIITRPITTGRQPKPKSGRTRTIPVRQTATPDMIGFTSAARGPECNNQAAGCATDEATDEDYSALLEALINQAEPTGIIGFPPTSANPNRGDQKTKGSADGAVSNDTDGQTDNEALLAEPVKIEAEVIIMAFCLRYRISKVDIVSARRTKLLIEPRHAAMYMTKRLTPLSLPDIGRCFGGRNHTTVLHAVRKIESLIENDPTFAEEMREIEEQLREQYAVA